MKQLLKLFTFALLMASSFACSTTLNLTAAEQNASKPELTDNDESAWMMYYRRQFEEYKGNVLPPTDSYPESARTAYQKTSNDWQTAKETAASGNRLIGTGIGLGCGLLSALASVVLLY